MKLSKFVFKTALVSLMLSGVSLAQADSLLDRINNHGTVSVGTEGTYAPFTYHDKSNKLVGYDVDVMRAIAKKLDIKLDFRETQWDAMMTGLKSGRFDVVVNQVGLTTPERQKTFIKSEPYTYSGAMLVTPKDVTDINKPEDVKGRKTAQSLSSNYGEMARKYQAKIVPVDGLAQSIMLINQKRAEATFNDELSFLDYMKQHPDANVRIAWRAGPDEKIGTSVVANKGNEEAMEKISQAVKELKEEGVLKELGEKYFGEDVSIPKK
ncbi:amino acid ABC transporter substrate-binding protein [Brackiella oedipodis]|uniref:amino acid ABC transporter substrate-binding protein n=1 Tax=Brackiella oedipodis TaxID=124225 RepID=UPI000491125A|nr:amino acid ABC transporter substrate-binding protein [Brackiella oedipodis]